LPLGLRPAFQGAQQEFLGLLADPHLHGVQVAYYARQHETAELIAHGNAIVLTGDKEWHVAHETTGLVDGSADRIPVRRYELVSAASGGRLLVLHWFTVAGIATNRADVAKILTAWSLLNGRGDHSTSTAIWIQVDRQPTESERDEIFRGMTPHAVAVHAAIDQAMK
jgi:EpsI family protein